MNPIFLELFPSISKQQVDLLSSLKSMYEEWNDKINVISRKDMENFDTHHLLYSLSIAHFFTFPVGSRIMDVGTGGGFPGIPLAILFPNVEFTLVDSIAKKIHVVTEISQSLGLNNVIPLRMRAEEVDDEFDYITGRAVTALPALVKLLKRKIKIMPPRNPVQGIIYLKGGDFSDELSEIVAEKAIYHLSECFTDPFFETKKIVHLHTFT